MLSKFTNFIVKNKTIKTKFYRDLQLNDLHGLKQYGLFYKYKSLKRIDFSNNQIKTIEVGYFTGGESIIELLVIK